MLIFFPQKKGKQETNEQWLTYLMRIVSVFGILKNPMILMGLVSMVLFIGLPKLVENSKKSPPLFYSLSHPFSLYKGYTWSVC